MSLILSQDMREAAVDAILASLGHAPKIMHPLADHFGDTPLSSIAAVCGATGHAGSSDRRAAVARGLATSDFASIVASAAQTFSIRRYEKASSHLAFTGKVEAKDFRPVEFVDISVSQALQHVGELGVVQPGRVAIQNTMSGQLLSYANNLQFSRELVINDQASLIQSALEAYGGAAAKTEARLVYEALRSNQLMNDGMPVFHAEFGNLLGSFFAPDAMEKALVALRRGAAPGDENIYDLDAAHLVVSANMEYACKKTLHEAGMGHEIRVTATSHLPDGEWFLLPDPDIQPVISVIRLAGSTTPVRLEPQKNKVNFDGFTIRAGADFGAVLVSRHAVRGGE